jgi:hypothetical protein
MHVFLLWHKGGYTSSIYGISGDKCLPFMEKVDIHVFHLWNKGRYMSSFYGIREDACLPFMA